MKDTYTNKRRKMIRKMQGKETAGEMVLGTALFFTVVAVWLAYYLVIKIIV